MDLIGIIRDLRVEREKLEQIITSLEQLQSSATKFTVPSESRRGRRSMDPQARMEVSQRMKKYWADRRKNGEGMNENSAPE